LQNFLNAPRIASMPFPWCCQTNSIKALKNGSVPEHVPQDGCHQNRSEKREGC